jgi:hypothetical protein
MLRRLLTRLTLFAALFVFVAGCGSDSKPPAGAGAGGKAGAPPEGVRGPTKRTKQTKAAD